jgi:hypothetical protein
VRTLSERLRGGRPAFGFGVEGPEGWHLLRTAPEHWQADVRRLVHLLDDVPTADGGVGRTLVERTRRELTQALTDTVAAAQRSGVVLTLVAFRGPGPVVDDAPEDRASVMTLSLGFLDGTPQPASLELARSVAEGDRGPDTVLRELPTPEGVAVLREDLLEAPVGSDLTFSPDGRHASAQAFLPLAGTPWTAVVSGTASRTTDAATLAALVTRTTTTFRREVPSRG